MKRRLAAVVLAAGLLFAAGCGSSSRVVGEWRAQQKVDRKTLVDSMGDNGAALADSMEREAKKSSRKWVFHSNGSGSFGVNPDLVSKSVPGRWSIKESGDKATLYLVPDRGKKVKLKVQFEGDDRFVTSGAGPDRVFRRVK